MKRRIKRSLAYRLAQRMARRLAIKLARKARLKILTQAIALAFAAPLVSQMAHANPLNPTVTSGSASFNNQGNTLTVTNTNGTVINWNSFSIGKGETTNFVQSGSNSQVLNRVTGGDPSQILGTLTSNGRVYLINPNGIAFGVGAQVNVAGLVASSLNISDADFAAGKLNFTDTPGAGKVTNQGTIQTPSGGQVYLVAPNVENSGVIVAPNGDVILAAGKTVSLVDPKNPEITVELTASMNQALNVGKIVGKNISIFAGTIQNTGTLNANAAVVGDGGRIILKAVDTASIGGTITAVGGSQSGNGGYVETSAAHLSIAPDAQISTKASNGTNGTWLIDPVDFTIAATGGDITGTALGTLLNSNSVIIQTATGTNTATNLYGATGTNGDIFVNQAISWNGGTTLTLNANRNINISASITSAAAGNLTLNAGQGGTGTSTLGAATINLNGGTLSFTKGLTIAGSNSVIQNATITSPDASTVAITGGTYLNGVTLDANATDTSALYIQNGLTFTNNHSLTIGGTAQWGYLLYSGNESITGTGQLVMGGYGQINNQSVANTSLTLGPNITVSGVAGSIGSFYFGNYGNDNIINQGTINLNQAQTYYTTGTFNNQGVINASNGNFDLGSSGTANTWSNTGTINLSGGTLNMGGTFNTAGIGNIIQTGGTANLTGTLTNTGASWNPGTTGLTSLNLNGGAIVGGTVTGTIPITNIGSSYLNGVTIDANISDTSALYIQNGLTFTNNHSLTIGSSAAQYGYLYYQGNVSITGTGQIVMGNYGQINNQSVAGTSLTLGPNITVTGQAGSTGTVYFGIYGNDHIINQGTINLNQGQTYYTYGNLTNQGVINASNGNFDLGNGTGNTWSNTGTINLSGGTLNMGGTFNTAGIGNITQTGGIANLTGTLTNTGASWNPGTTGLTSLNLNGGAIVGGTVTGTIPITNTGSSYLNGVTLDANISDTSVLYIQNGLTFTNNHSITVGSSVAQYGYLIYQGNESITGTGQIVMGSYGQINNQSVAGTSLTLGPNITVTGQAGSTGYVFFGSYANDNIINQGTINLNQAQTYYTTGTFNNQGSVNVSAGTVGLGYTTASTWSNTGAINLSGGTLNMGGTFNTAGIGNITQTGGTANLTGTLTNTGATWNPGTTGLTSLNLNGGTIVGGTVTGTIPITNIGGSYLNGVTLDANISDTSALYIQNGLTFTNNHSITVGNLSQYGYLYYQGNESITGTGQIVMGNYGQINNQSVAGTSLTLGSNITVSGVAGSTGTFYFGGYANDNIINQGTINLNQAQTYYMAGTFNNQGSVNVSAGTVNLGYSAGGTWSNTGTIHLSGGALNMGGAFNTAGIGNIAQTGGTANLTGTLTNTGATWNPGTTGLTSLNLNGGTIVGGTVTGTIPITNIGGSYLNGVTLDANITDTSWLYIQNGLTFTNNHSLTIGSNAAQYGYLVYQGNETIGGTGQLVMGNYGQINNQSVAGTSLTLGPNITVSGLAGSTNSFNFGGYPNDNIINQGTINFNQAQTYYAFGNFTNQGTVNVSAGTVNLGYSTGGTWSNAGTIHLSGGTLNMGGAFNTAGIGTIIQTGGTANLTGTLTNTGASWNPGTTGLTSLNLAGGTILNGTVTGTIPITVTASTYLNGVTLDANISDTNWLYIQNGLTFTNNHSITVGAPAQWGYLIYQGNETIGGTGQLVMGNYGQIYSQGAANTSLTLGPNITMSGLAGSNGVFYFGGNTSDNIINQGTINLNQAQTYYTYGTFTNQGTVNVSSSSMNLVNASTFNNTSTGVLAITNGAAVSASGATFNNSGDVEIGALSNFYFANNTTTQSFNNQTSGVIRGNGTLNLGYTSVYVCAPTCAWTYPLNTLTNNGTIDPGMGVNGIGKLTINGNVVMGSTGKIHIDLGGTGAGQYDQLVVSGLTSPVTSNPTLTLGGTLEVAELGAAVSGAYFAGKGDAFANLITVNGGASGITGSFATNSIVTTPGYGADVAFTYASTAGSIGISNTTVSTTRWINTAGGLWNAPANWSRGIPGGTMDAIAANGATTTITINSAVTTPLTLNLTDSLTLATGGSYTLNSGITSYGSTLTMAGGTLTNNNALSLTGPLVLTGGTINGTGSVTMATGSTASASTGSTTISETFNNASSVSVASGTLNLAGGGTQSGSFNVASGANLNFTGGTNSFADGSSFSGAGSFNGTGATNQLTGTTTGLAIANGTTLDLLAFPLTGSGILTNNGTVNGTGATMGGSIVNNALVNLSGSTLNGVFNNSSGATLSLSGTNTFNGGMNLSAGSSTLGATGSTLNMAGSALTLIGSGTASVSGLNITGVGPTTIASGQTLGLTGTTMSTTWALNNAGSVSLTGSTLNVGGGGTSSAGSFTADAASTVAFNAGTFTASGNTSFGGAGTYSLAGGNLANNGALSVAGVFSLNGGTYSGTGTTTMNSGSTLNFNSGTWSNTGALSNSGTLNLGSGSVASAITNNAIANLTNTTLAGGFTNNSGTLNVTGNVISSANSTIAGGTVNLLSGATLTENIGTLNWNGGTIAGSGTLAFTNGGLIAFSGSGNRVMNSPGLNFSFTDLSLPSGSLTLQQGQLTFNTTGTNSTLLPSGTTLNLNGGTLTNNGPLNIAGIFNITGGTYTGTGSLVMAGGTLNNTGGSWTSTGTLTNTGTLNLGGGTYTSPIVNSGTITASGATFSGGFTNSGSTSTLNLSGANTFNGGLALGGGSNTTGTAGTTINLAGGTLSLFGTGASATVTGVGISGGPVTVLTGQTLNLTGSTLNSAQVLTNNGIINLVGTTATFTGGGSMNTGSFTADAASIMNLGGGTFTMAGNTTLAGAGTFNLNGGAFAGAGTLTNTGVLNITANTTMAGGLINSGTLTESNGVTLTDTAGYTQTAGTTWMGPTTGTTATLNGNVVVSGGIYYGSGTLGGNLTMNGGTLAPGHSPGVLNITGNLTLTPNATTIIEIGGTTAGTGFDQVNVTGLATMGGNLSIVSYLGYVPPAATTFTFLNFGTTAGTFSTITMPTAWGSTLAQGTTFLQMLMPGAVVTAPPPVTTPTATAAFPGSTATQNVIVAMNGPASGGGAVTLDGTVLNPDSLQLLVVDTSPAASSSSTGSVVTCP